MQECASGLVSIRRDAGYLSFAAPRLLRTGPLEPEILARASHGLGLSPDAVIASQWIDNGPGWVGLLLRSREEVLAIRPDYTALDRLPVGVVGRCETCSGGFDAQFEVRAFSYGGYGDPATGSSNAAIAQWLIRDGVAPTTYVASQGTALGRPGRVHLRQEGNDIWVGGAVSTCIVGTVQI